MGSRKMTKASQIKPQKVFAIDLQEFAEHKPSLDLDSPKKIKALMLEMISAGDYDAFFELVEVYIDHIGKKEFVKRSKIPERTVYNFKGSKHGTSAANVFAIMRAMDYKPTRRHA